MASVLFHGPGARQEALDDARERGSLMVDPIGDDGLKIADAREAVELFLTAHLGKRRGAVVIGPMDLAQPGAADALLKTVEELDDSKYVLNLWAHDLAEVVPTIQSRCQDRWCPNAPPDDDSDAEIYERALDALSAYRSGDYVGVIEALGSKENTDPQSVLRLVPEILAGDIKAGRFKTQELGLWTRLRKVLTFHNISRTEAVAAMLPEAS